MFTHINLASLKDDLMGGLLASIIGLPMGLAFGIQSGLGPQAGIFTAIILAIVASFFGGTKTLISDPTGPMTVVAATVVSMGIAQRGDLETAWPLIVGTFVLAGVFEILFGILDLGKYVKFMPYPVLSGFMAGIGVIIISVQVYPLLGHASPKGFSQILLHLDEPLTHIDFQSLFLGGLTIAIIYVLPMLTKKIPSILVALIVGTVTSVALQLNVPVIGEIPRELPKMHLNDIFSIHWSDIHYIITPAIMIGGLGVIDSLLTSVVADNLTKTQHNSKWTVIGQGVGNLITGLFGGIPGAGATMGTVTNIKTGATSKISGIMKGIFLLIIIVSIADFVQYIPMSVLSGILITIGIGIIDIKGVKMLFKVPRQDAVVWMIVLFVTLFDNLLDAVGIGFALSSVLFIGRMTKNMTNTHSVSKLSDIVDGSVIREKGERIMVKQLDGPLFFGFADRFRAYCESIKDVDAVILRMNMVPFLDQSGIITLESVIDDWEKRGIEVYFTEVNDDVYASLIKLKLFPGMVPEKHVFSRFEDAIEHFSEVQHA